MSTPVEVLTHARDRVKRGWCQGMIRNNDDGEVCAVGAVADAAHELGIKYVNACGCIFCIGENDVVVRRAFAFLITAIEEETLLQWPSIPDWNDYDGRIQAEVVDTFDHAIKLAERDA